MASLRPAAVFAAAPASYDVRDQNQLRRSVAQLIDTITTATGPDGITASLPSALTGLPTLAAVTADDTLLVLDAATTPSMATASAKRIGHPAPFPVELPRRLIELYTFTGDLVLDPFMGSGSTAVAAQQSGRHYVGYDTSVEYLDLARQRIAAGA